MTDPPLQPPQPPERPRRTFWQLMPKRTLIKGVWLLVMLLAIVWFQNKSGSCAKLFTHTIAPPPPTGQDGKPGRTVGGVILPGTDAATGDGGDS